MSSEGLQHLLNGLSLGSIYALMAIGYTLVYGVLRLMNFAHGDLLMIGAYGGFYLARALNARSALDWLCVWLGSSLLTGLLSLLIERLAYRPLARAPRLNLLITSIGVSLLLEFGGQTLFGSEPRFFPQLPLADPAQGWRVPAAIALFSLALALALQWTLMRTRLGAGLRALSEDATLARLQGVPATRLTQAVFFLSGALAGTAGVSFALLYPKIDPFMGLIPGLKCFSAAVLGGIGSVPGAALGALILGLSEEALAALGAASFRDALAFILLVVLLIARPQGILGRAEQEKA